MKTHGWFSGICDDRQHRHVLVAASTKQALAVSRAFTLMRVRNVVVGNSAVLNRAISRMHPNASDAPDTLDLLILTHSGLAVGWRVYGIMPWSTYELSRPERAQLHARGGQIPQIRILPLVPRTALWVKKS